MLSVDTTFPSSPLVPQRLFWKNAFKSPIGFHPFIEKLHEFNGPDELKVFFARKIKGKEKRLDVAVRFNIFPVIVECLVEIRSRALANEIKQKLLLEPDWRAGDCATQIEDALLSPKIKWKAK